MNIIYNELYLFYRFCKSNSLATIGPGVFMIIRYILIYDVNFDIIYKFINLILYNILYIYQFDILNQIKGIEEDKINKPDRPLASRLINKKQAIKRYIIVSFLYIIISYKKLVFFESFIWFLVTILYNIVELDKNWFLKTLLMAPAIYTLISADVKILYTINILKNMELLKKTFVLIIVGTMTIFVQEFRDVQGDLKINRITFPIKFGINKSRYYCSFLNVFGMIIINYFCFKNKEYLNIILNTLLLFISVRIVLKTKIIDDKITYDIWCVWYCANYLFIY